MSPGGTALLAGCSEKYLQVWRCLAQPPGSCHLLIFLKVERELLQRKGLVLAAAFGTALLHDYAQLSPCSFLRDTLEILIP